MGHERRGDPVLTVEKINAAAHPLTELPQHGVDGWTLSRFSWSESTGKGEFVYVHKVHGELTVTRPQPTLPHHEGWPS